MGDTRGSTPPNEVPRRELPPRDYARHLPHPWAGVQQNAQVAAQQGHLGCEVLATASLCTGEQQSLPRHAIKVAGPLQSSSCLYLIQKQSDLSLQNKKHGYIRPSDRVKGSLMRPLAPGALGVLKAHISPNLHITTLPVSVT
jgi:hypothetical protein